MNDEPKRGPGRPRKVDKIEMEQVIDLAREKGIKVESVDASSDGISATVKVTLVQFMTITPTGRRKIVRRKK